MDLRQFDPVIDIYAKRAIGYLEPEDLRQEYYIKLYRSSDYIMRKDKSDWMKIANSIVHNKMIDLVREQQCRELVLVGEYTEFDLEVNAVQHYCVSAEQLKEKILSWSLKKDDRLYRSFYLMFNPTVNKLIPTRNSWDYPPINSIVRHLGYPRSILRGLKELRTHLDLDFLGQP